MIREDLWNFINNSKNFSVCAWNNNRQYLGALPIKGYRCVDDDYTWTGVLYNGLTIDLPAECITKREIDISLPSYISDLKVPETMQSLIGKASLEMRDIAPFAPFDNVIIIGFRYIKAELFYTVLSKYGETYDVPVSNGSGLYNGPCFF